MTHDVFISYSTKDKRIADAICANLEAVGIRCWIAPRDIAPGEDWPTAIALAISQCKVMVLVFSESANSSDQISRELCMASDDGLVIIPFKVDNIRPEPGKQYYLARTHWLDAMNPPTQDQIDLLVERARTLLIAEGNQPASTRTFRSPDAQEKKALTQRLKRQSLGKQRLWLIFPSFFGLGILIWTILTFATHTLPLPAGIRGKPTETLATTPTREPTQTSTITATVTPEPTAVPKFIVSLISSSAILYDQPEEDAFPSGAATGEVEILGETDTCKWFKVQSETGSAGWIPANQISFTGICSDLPVAIVPPLATPPPLDWDQRIRINYPSKAEDWPLWKLSFLTSNWDTVIWDDGLGHKSSKIQSELPIIADFDATVFARRQSGSGEFGIIYRCGSLYSSCPGNFYYFIINDINQTFSVWSRTNYPPYAIINWKTEPSIANGGKNSLGIYARGDRFTFVINGRVVGRIIDSASPIGYVGIIEIPTDRNLYVEYSDFVVNYKK